MQGQIQSKVFPKGIKLEFKGIKLECLLSLSILANDRALAFVLHSLKAKLFL